MRTPGPMKLSWSQDSNGNWNGKRGQYTLMVVAYHVRPGFRHDGNLTRTADGDWHLHPKLPGLKSVPVQTAQAGMQGGQKLFDDWRAEIEVGGIDGHYSL